MPQTAIENLPDDARAWVFGISPALDESGTARLLARIDPFLAQWAAHNQPINSSRDVIEGSFLVIAVDHESETSGCSIDRMFGTLRQLESELGVQILDPNRSLLPPRRRSRRRTSRRSAFRENGDAPHLVFDTIVERSARSAADDGNARREVVAPANASRLRKHRRHPSVSRGTRAGGGARRAAHPRRSLDSRSG